MVVVMLMCRRLAKQGISLVFPEVLKQGASADTVCFDKTGTLTGSLVSYCSASVGSLFPVTKSAGRSTQSCEAGGVRASCHYKELDVKAPFLAEYVWFNTQTHLELCLLNAHYHPHLKLHARACS